MTSTSKKALDSLASMWDRVETARKRAELAVLGDAEIPTDNFTVQEYAAKFNLLYGTAAHQTKKLVREGILASGRAYRTDVRGHVVVTKVFWLVEEGVWGTNSGCGGTTGRTTGKT